MSATPFRSQPGPAGDRLSADDDRPRNRLLAMLSPEDFEYLRPRLQTMPIAVRQVLVKAGKPLEAVYFLNGGVASMTKVLTDGAMVEVATVGDEGIIGIEALLNEKPEPPGEVLVQVSAENAAMTAER